MSQCHTVIGVLLCILLQVSYRELLDVLGLGLGFTHTLKP
jgi:urea transporter